jgi:hypothetical protein
LKAAAGDLDSYDGSTAQAVGLADATQKVRLLNTVNAVDTT